MKPLIKRATYDDLREVPENFVAEMFDGELYASPRPANPHTYASSKLGAKLAAFFDPDGAGGWVILDEPELHFGNDVLVPDIARWRRSRMPNVPPDAYFTLAPDWICEVISPSTEAIDRTKKLRIYARVRVAHAWLLDPLRQTLEVLSLESAGWAPVATHGGRDKVRAVPFDALELELGALWIQSVMDTAPELAEHAGPGGCAMKYPVWFVRLIFAAWMIPAGLNHFITLFPQPVGTKPLSQELFYALFDSHLFDLVKAVELVAGVGVLLGAYVPLSLAICMPVSFCVWYWDTPLEGWGSGASIFGTAVLVSNVLLLLAYFGSYRSMFALRSAPRALGTSDASAAGKQLVLAARLIFGASMLVNGINYFFVSLYPLPSGHEPLAVQLMTGLEHSHLLAVVMGIELVAGALILIGVFVPAALCVVMPISVCAAFWAILDHQPLGLLLGLGAIALNGVLMLAYIEYYKGVLQRHALAVGET